MNQAKCILVCVCMFLACLAIAQPKQTIKGTVTDAATLQPVIGATVTIESVDPVRGTTTDVDGKFSINMLPLGRHTVRVSYLGYADYVNDEVVLNSAKTATLNIQLAEAAYNASEDEIVVYANRKSSTPLNSLSVVSTRAFSVEETQRYAATVNDPGRMAQGLAGVQASQDNNNDIVVRGNSPLGVLWRVEGADIVNPNHFARVGSSGGGITIFSASLLGQSDFSTGAFAAEYGNALSSVFDIRFRPGNNEKREHTIRAGMLGLDFATEGPIKKGRSSYLVNYRYSTLGILNDLGFRLVGERVDNNFQDLSFNLVFPSKNNKRTFTVFGLGGLSDELEEPVQDTALWNGPLDYTQAIFNTKTGAIGATFTQLLNEKSYLKTVVALSGTNVLLSDDTVSTSLLPKTYRLVNSKESRLSLQTYYSNRINDKLTMKAGLFAHRIGFDILQQERDTISDLLSDQVRVKESTGLFQGFAQAQYKLSPKLTLLGGFHATFLALNNTWSIDPRLALKYNVNQKSTLSFAYGLHSRTLPWGTYFTLTPPTSSLALPNLDLEMIKSHHLVLSYDYAISDALSIKSEVYYQHLFDAPVSNVLGYETYSPLNDRDRFSTVALISEGTGRNMGLDVVVERSFRNGWFAMMSGSFFNSTYVATDGQRYNTRFNSGWGTTTMGAKEFTLGKQKASALQVGARFTANGGLRSTPLDDALSAAAQAPIEIASRAFEDQAPAFVRLDLRFAYRRNRPNLAWWLALDVQNVTARTNINPYRTTWDPVEQKLVEDVQSGLIPILSFQLDF